MNTKQKQIDSIERRIEEIHSMVSRILNMLCDAMVEYNKNKQIDLVKSVIEELRPKKYFIALDKPIQPAIDPEAYNRSRNDALEEFNTKASKLLEVLNNAKR